ncbi:hypothetical protein CH300_10210 [Rhodococcus sp. 15-1154-1]|nr:hypothetical protein CH300_10210 [Rhodococcus sp. 15-1154-1]
MLHLRVISPSERTSHVLRMLAAESTVTHVTLAVGAAIDPPGDVVEADVAPTGHRSAAHCRRNSTCHGTMSRTHAEITRLGTGCADPSTPTTTAVDCGNGG